MRNKTTSSFVFSKTTGVAEPAGTVRDSAYYWQLWHHNWDDSDIALAAKWCGDEKRRVLEIGCADGRVALGLAASGHSVTGIDIDERLISIAKERRALANFDNVEFLVMNAEKLSLAHESYDVVLFPWSLQFVADPVEVVRESYRVLKPGGLILLIGLLSEGDYERIIRHFVPNLPRIDPEAQYLLPFSRIFGGASANIILDNRQSFDYYFLNAQIAFDAFVFALDFWYGRKLQLEEHGILKDLIATCRRGGEQTTLRFFALTCVAYK